jgi:hypothetical protein
VHDRKVGETDVLTGAETYDSGFAYDASSNLIARIKGDVRGDVEKGSCLLLTLSR